MNIVKRNGMNILTPVTQIVKNYGQPLNLYKDSHNNHQTKTKAKMSIWNNIYMSFLSRWKLLTQAGGHVLQGGEDGEGSHGGEGDTCEYEHHGGGDDVQTIKGRERRSDGCVLCIIVTKASWDILKVCSIQSVLA